ncbi:BUB1-related (BUB1: budding uninhibited by benzymidazol 1) [Carex rostrata]
MEILKEEDVVREMMNDEVVQMKLGNVELGTEWEMFKENIRPLKRGRNISMLNRSLKAQIDPKFKSQLAQTRRRMIEAIEEYQGDDPLQPWIQCIKWVQESFPSGGDCSGLIVIYEQCVRSFWHESRYKEDLRYLKIWMEYASNCFDAEVIYNFLEANEIGQSHALFYSSYALHMEKKFKFRKADEIFNLGIARKAVPLEKLEDMYRSFLSRLIRRKQQQKEEEENSTSDSVQPVRSFGTVLTGAANLTTPRPLQRVVDANTRKPLAIYNDENSVPGHKNEKMKSVESNSKKPSWYNLGTQATRNKENNPIPSKWTSYKVPPRAGAVPAAPPTTPTCKIEIYPDEEESPKSAKSGNEKTSKKSGGGLKLRKATSKNLKTETELLRENPLRNFPVTSFR